MRSSILLAIAVVSSFAFSALAEGPPVVLLESGGFGTAVMGLPGEARGTANSLSRPQSSHGPLVNHAEPSAPLAVNWLDIAAVTITPVGLTRRACPPACGTQRYSAMITGTANATTTSIYDMYFIDIDFLNDDTLVHIQGTPSVAIPAGSAVRYYVEFTLHCAPLPLCAVEGLASVVVKISVAGAPFVPQPGPPAGGGTLTATGAVDVNGDNLVQLGFEEVNSGPNWGAGPSFSCEPCHPKAGAGECQDTPTGSCCLADSSCLGSVTPLECSENNGTYMGDGTVCGGIDCTPPLTGPCLLPPNMECAEGLTQAECLAVGGQYDENGASCDATNVLGEPAESMRARLRPTFPNPFNPATTIRYDLSATTSVKVTIFSLDGKLVRTLQGWSTKRAGSHEIRWDGRDAQGRAVTSGVYYCTVETPTWGATRAMVLIK